MQKLNQQEIERYARHIIMPEIGGFGQQKLKEAKVLVVGAGGLGAPVLSYLAAVGIGHLGIIDDDIVSLSNLQRQIIYRTEQIGRAKSEAAAEFAHDLNPHIQIEQYCQQLNAENGKTILADYDIIIDGCDNFATRYLVADLCENLQKPLISGAIGRFDGSVTVFMAYKDNNPRMCDLFPPVNTPENMQNCAELGVIGALPGVIGSLQAMEAIKIITNIGKPLIGRLLLYNSLASQFDIIHYKRQ